MDPPTVAHLHRPLAPSTHVPRSPLDTRFTSTRYPRQLHQTQTQPTSTHPLLRLTMSSYATSFTSSFEYSVEQLRSAQPYVDLMASPSAFFLSLGIDHEVSPSLCSPSGLCCALERAGVGASSRGEGREARTRAQERGRALAQPHLLLSALSGVPFCRDEPGLSLSHGLLYVLRLRDEQRAYASCAIGRSLSGVRAEVSEQESCGRRRVSPARRVASGHFLFFCITLG